jgi:hypothetical protein
MAFQEMVESDSKEPMEETKKHRNSDATSGNSLIIKTESGLTDNIEHFLPSCTRELSFSFPTTDIFDIFSTSSSKKRFQVIEKNSSMATAVYRERYSFKNILLCCLPPEQRQQTVLSAARLCINVNETACKRVVTLKGIYGYPQVILPLISDFLSRLDAAVGASKSTRLTYENLSNEEDETVITCKHESSSYYQFHKILSSENYTLGKTIADFSKAFSELYRNPEESVNMLPLPLDSVKETVEQAVETLFTHYNYGRANTERMMSFCRPAVEKYVYGKVYPVLFAIYECKSGPADREIAAKRLRLSALDGPEAYREVGIKAEFMLPGGYSEAVDMLERAEELKSPIEKINCITSAVSAIHASVIDFSKGTAEILDVQDEVRIVAFVILKSRLKTPAAEAELVKDYLGFKFVGEYKEVLTVNLALNCIVNELNF